MGAAGGWAGRGAGGRLERRPSTCSAPLLWFLCKYNLLRPVGGTRAFIPWHFPHPPSRSVIQGGLKHKCVGSQLCWQR